jgi:hypothetical protein
LTTILSALFPFLTVRHQRLKGKCFAVLFSLLATLTMIIYMVIALNHLSTESIEYILAIHRHYKLTRIYKLSQDAKLSIDRLLSSINIRLGYSSLLALFAAVLSLIDGILLMISCKINYDYVDVKLAFTGIPSDPCEQNNDSHSSDINNSDEHSAIHPAKYEHDCLSTIDEHCNNQSNKPSGNVQQSCLKRSSLARIHFEDEV